MQGSTWSAGARLLWLTLVTAAALVVGATAATVYAAKNSTRKQVASATKASPLSLEPSRNVTTVRALADSLVMPLGAFLPIDSATLAQIVALVAGARDSAAWIAHAPADTSVVVAMATYRRWTRSAPLPAFWGAPPGFIGISDSRAIPMLHKQQLKRLWKANEAAADSALLTGDTATALMRARETIAGARHLLEQPRPVDALVGRAMLSDGAMLLARAALQANQPSLNSAAKRLLTLARQLQPVPLGFYTMNNGDANDARLLDIARDRTLHPAARFVTIELMVAGACHRTREVLFGPSAARHDAVNAMINATRDIPRLVELRASFHRTLDKLERSPTTFMGDATAAPANTSIPQTLLRLLVPGKVQARIYACTLSGA